MPQSPAVSVIMPLYNKRSYVRRAIESVQRQTFSDRELIIIDDGSTDGSASEVPIDNKKIRLIHMENAGPAAARNRGIREARGEFITFLDADDVYYPHKLKEEMTLLRDEKKAKWMISAFDRETDNKIEFQGVNDIHGNELHTQVLVVNKALCELSMQGIHIDGLCIDRQVLLNVGGFNEKMRCFEIAEFVIRCALEQPRVLVCLRPLYRVVDVPESAFKVSRHRIDGMSQMGESLYGLSLRYPESSQVLIPRSRKAFLSHATSLIHSDRKREARECLVHNFPYARDKKWWKLWILSWIPSRMLDLKYKEGLNN